MSPTAPSNEPKPAAAAGAEPRGALPPFPGAEGGGVSDEYTALPVDHFGTNLYLRTLTPPTPSKPPVVLVHDIGEHADCYDATAEAFVARGYPVYLYDMRGHGRSGRQLGHAPSFHALVNDLLQVAAWARYQQGGQAPIVLGHGVGALVVLEFTVQRGSFCRAAVLSAPCQELHVRLTLLRRLAIKLIADLAPMVHLRPPLGLRLTRERLTSHPSQPGDGKLTARFPGITAQLTQELVAAMQKAPLDSFEFGGKVLFLCPEKDGICGYQRLKKSAAMHTRHNCEVIDLPETGHSVFTGDPHCREQAIEAISSWLARSSADGL